MVDKLKWGVGGGLAIIFLGHFAAFIGLLDGGRITPLLAGGGALILWTSMIFLLREKPGDEIARSPAGLEANTPVPSAAQERSSPKAPNFGRPDLSPKNSLPRSTRYSNGTRCPSFRNLADRSELRDYHTDSEFSDAEPEAVRILADVPETGSRNVSPPPELLVERTTIIFEARRMFQRWIEADPRPPFRQFLSQRGYFLILSPHLSAALRLQLTASEEGLALPQAHEADLVRSYVSEVERLGERWSVSQT